MINRAVLVFIGKWAIPEKCNWIFIQIFIRSSSLLRADMLDSVCDFDNEPNGAHEGDDTQRSFEERTGRVDFLWKNRSALKGLRITAH